MLETYFLLKNCSEKQKIARGCYNLKKLLQKPKVAQTLPNSIGTGGNRPFYINFVSLASQPLSEREAGVDLVLIQTSFFVTKIILKNTS